MMTLSSILMPVDFSEPSREATHYALFLAQKFGARLDLLYVIDDSQFFSPAFGGFTPTREQWEAFADTSLENWLTAEVVGDVKVTRHRILGTPFLQIVRYARDQNSDLIVMGTHGRSGMMAGLLGSVAEKVLRKAPCPVLTVKSGAHEP